MANLKNLVLLHSNDMHGDFLSEDDHDTLVGGIAMLSGYVNKVKQEQPNTLYCIAGDMLQGSLIDTEFKGLSTIEIMNMLNPDVVSLGNHEIDYGVAHLLFLERCAKFPIVTANLYINNPYTRLFHPQKILRVDGMRIMFIGIITSEVMSGIKQDPLLGSFLDIEDAAREVGRICNAYKTTDIDFTVLLTHIGFEEDKKLAALLDPLWGVDVIIGGHSHTLLDKAEKVNDVLIVQAGVGTDQIGRFDLVVNTDTNSVHEYTWQTIPVNKEHCPRDTTIEQTIRRYKEQTDLKYERMLCKFPRVLTHPNRYRETELGNLMCDALKDLLGVDIMVLGSGSIRREEAGPVFTYGNLLEVMPYDDTVLQLKLTGRQFKDMYAFMLRDEALTGEHTEFYQFSHGLEVVYDRKTHAFRTFSLGGVPLEDEHICTVGLQGFHYLNFEEFFNLPIDEVEALEKPRAITTSLLDVLEEYFMITVEPSASVEGRLVIVE